MKEIQQLIQKLGYKKIGKDFSGGDMFEKGNAVVYLRKITFKKRKTETFKEISKRLHE